MESEIPEILGVTVDRLRFWVALTIVVVWVASLLLAAAVPAFRIQPTVHVLMMLVAGWLFGPTMTGKGRK